MTDKPLSEQLEIIPCGDGGPGKIVPDDLIERLRNGDATNYGGDLQALLDDAADALEEWARAGTRWSEKTSQLQDEVERCREQYYELTVEITKRNTELDMAWRQNEALQKTRLELHAEVKRLEAKLEHLVDARNVWGELNWHDAFMKSQKERCRLNVEVASLRARVEELEEKLVKIAYPPDDIDAPHYPVGIARAALEKKP